jgi:hypothetical protein
MHLVYTRVALARTTVDLPLYAGFSGHWTRGGVDWAHFSGGGLLEFPTTIQY